MKCGWPNSLIFFMVLSIKAEGKHSVKSPHHITIIRLLTWMDRRKRFLRFSCMVRLFCWSTDPRVKCVQGNNMDRCTGCSQRRSHTPQHLKCKKHFLLSSEILVQSKFGFVLQKITWSYDTITTHGKVIIIWNVILPNKTVPGKGGRLSSWHQAS